MNLVRSFFLILITPISDPPSLFFFDIELLKKQKPASTNNTSLPAQTRTPRPPPGMPNSAASAQVVNSLVRLQSSKPFPQPRLSSTPRSMRHPFPSALKPPTSSIPSSLRSWVTLLLRATHPRILIHLPHHRPPFPFQRLQNTPLLGPVAPAVDPYRLPSPATSSLRLS
jgi:hypothetical protein